MILDPLDRDPRVARKQLLLAAVAAAGILTAVFSVGLSSGWFLPIGLGPFFVLLAILMFRSRSKGGTR